MSRPAFETPDGSPCAAITFDLDGLARDPFASPPSAREIELLRALAFDVVVPRILWWLEIVNVKATFFAIGSDVERFPDAFAALSRAGHEVASHTFSHARDFSRHDEAAVRDDLARAEDAIAAATGIRPCGFRAPGYTISSTAIGVLADRGYAYDASVVPSWSYTTLKRLFAIGRPQFRDYLIPQEYACARAPKLPYRIAHKALFAPSEHSALVEIPVTAIGTAQFPFIHGLSARLPLAGRCLVERLARRRPFFSFAFHDLEFADRSDYGALPASGITEPHLRVPIGKRLDDLTQQVVRAQQTHRFRTLREVAAATIAGPL